MRVVGGRLRSREIAAPKSSAIRPTADRLRESLFNILIHGYGDPVSGARVLDLFAGTGALGIEALSRGAREAVFVERARSALRILRRNLEELELASRARVVDADLSRGLGALARNHGAFGVVLADPPYGAAWPERLLRDPALAQLVEPDGAVVIERSARETPEPPPAPLRLRDTKRYGETAFDWWEFAA